jgi:hypothetical protein
MASPVVWDKPPRAEEPVWRRRNPWLRSLCGMMCTTGQSRLRDIFLKTSNALGGRYLAELTQAKLAHLEEVRPESG